MSPAMVTADQFESALSTETWPVVKLWPSLEIRTTKNATRVFVSRLGEGPAFAEFYLNAYGERGRDAELVAIACGALNALNASLSNGGAAQ